MLPGTTVPIWQQSFKGNTVDAADGWVKEAAPGTDFRALALAKGVPIAPPRVLVRVTSAPVPATVRIHHGQPRPTTAQPLPTRRPRPPSGQLSGTPPPAHPSSPNHAPFVPGPATPVTVVAHD